MPSRSWLFRRSSPSDEPGSHVALDLDDRFAHNHPPDPAPCRFADAVHSAILMITSRQARKVGDSRSDAIEAADMNVAGISREQRDAFVANGRTTLSKRERTTGASCGSSRSSTRPAGRRCAPLALTVARQLKHEDVLAVLADLFIARGPPAHIRSDTPVLSEVEGAASSPLPLPYAGAHKGHCVAVSSGETASPIRERRNAQPDLKSVAIRVPLAAPRPRLLPAWHETVARPALPIAPRNRARLAPWQPRARPFPHHRR